MQKPLDLSMSILRQCCAEAMPTSRTSERHLMVGLPSECEQALAAFHEKCVSFFESPIPTFRADKRVTCAGASSRQHAQL